MTPTETAHWAANPQDENFSVLQIVARPPTTLTLVEDENRRDIVRRYATPAEARWNKRNGIEAGERQGWVPLQGFQGRFECAAYVCERAIGNPTNAMHLALSMNLLMHTCNTSFIQVAESFSILELNETQALMIPAFQQAFSMSFGLTDIGRCS